MLACVEPWCISLYRMYDNRVTRTLMGALRFDPPLTQGSFVKTLSQALLSMLYMGLSRIHCILISCTVYDGMIDIQEHIKGFCVFHISPTTLIISLTHRLLQTKRVYVLDNIECYKVLPLNLSLMVNKGSFSCPIRVGHVMKLQFWKVFQCFRLNTHSWRQDFAAPTMTYNIPWFHLLPPLYYREY